MAQLDYNIPMGVRAPNLGQLADGYMAGYDFAQKAKANKRALIGEEQRQRYEVNNEARRGQQEQREIANEGRQAKLFDQQQQAYIEDRKQKRRSALAQLLGDEAEALANFKTPELQSEYYKNHLLPSLKEEGFDVSDLDQDFTPELIDTWRMQALPPEKREALRQDREKLRLENDKKTKFDAWRESINPFLRGKSYKLKQDDVNRIMSGFPSDLAGYKPAEDFINNLKTELQPPYGTVYTPRMHFQDVMALRKDFEDNLEIKAAKIAYQKANQINALHRDYNRAKLSGKPLSPAFSDQVFGVNFNKLIDELSTVMPSEFDRITSTAGLTSRLIGTVKQAIDGGLKLAPEDREELVRVANKLVEITNQEARPVYDQFKNEASIIKANPSRVVGSASIIFGDNSTSNIPAPKSSYTQPNRIPQPNTQAPAPTSNKPFSAKGKTKSGLNYTIKEK